MKKLGPKADPRKGGGSKEKVPREPGARKTSELKRKSKKGGRGRKEGGDIF